MFLYFLKTFFVRKVKEIFSLLVLPHEASFFSFFHPMKTSFSATLLATILFASLLSLSPASADRGMRQSFTIPQGEIESLSPSEEAALIYGQQEERLARDVYQNLFDQYDLDIFSRISQSEQKHMDALGKALSTLSLPETEGYGELQSTYEALIEKGTLSLQDAIEVGITIELLDIKDLDATIALTENSLLKKIYTNLRRGSVHHLKAFVRELEKNDFETEIEYQSFLSSDDEERGHRGGQQKRQGKGHYGGGFGRMK